MIIMTMHNTKKISLKNINVLLLSLFGAGFFPVAPGTFGSLVTIPLLFALGLWSPSYYVTIPLIIFLTIWACLATHKIQLKMDVKDPSWIVFDELLGMFTTWLFLPTHNPLNLLIIFVLFRFFDILKIWPASYIDKKMKNGIGVILDDITSGIMAGIIYLVIGIYFL